VVGDRRELPRVAARNVARENVRPWREAVLVGAVGRDAAATAVRDELANAGVTEARRREGGVPTTVKNPASSPTTSQV